MRALTSSILVAVLLLAGCKGYEMDHRDYSDDNIQWGPAVNGLQAGLGRRLYDAGKAPGRDQVYFTVQLRNVSGKEMKILAPVALGGIIPEKKAGDESVSVKLNYDSAAGIKTAEFKPSDKPSVQVLEPDKVYKLELRLSPSRFGMDRFVNGRISASYSNAQGTIKYSSLPEATSGLWTGEAKSGAVNLDVLPDGAAK